MIMSFHRIIFIILILISIVFNIIYIHAYSIRIKGGERSCYFVKTIVGVPITGSYEVILPDPDFISVEVSLIRYIIKVRNIIHDI